MWPPHEGKPEVQLLSENDATAVMLLEDAEEARLGKTGTHLGLKPLPVLLVQGA